MSVDGGRDQAAKSYRLLRAILNTAVDDELIVRNPCRIRGGGAEHADERPMIDAALVFKLADSVSERLRALIVLVGLRSGELLGIRRCDVDIEDGRLTVLVQAQQVVGMGRIVTGPKSEAGQRTVSLPKVAVEALEKRELRPARRIRARDGRGMASERAKRVKALCAACDQGQLDGGGDRNRTGVQGFAGRVNRTLADVGGRTPQVKEAL